MRNLLVFGALVAAGAPAAMAQEAATFTGNISLVSDYQFRNVTQTNHDMTIQGGIDFNAGGFYVGTWASGVDFNDASDVNLEVDLYGGYRFDLAGFGLDLGAIYYTYADGEDADLDFYEVYGKVSRSFGAFTAATSVNYDPDSENLYLDLTGSLALGDLTLSANAGQWLEGMGEYTGYNVGATYTFLGTQFGARWYSNDQDTPNFDQDGYVISIGRAL